MARDYKNRAARKKAANRTPVWIWLVTGYLFGSLSVGMIWWSQAPSGPQGAGWIGAKPRSMQSAVPGPDAESEAVDSQEIEPPHYEFYSLLKEQEVVVPDEELEGKPRKPPADKVAEPDTEVAEEAAPVPVPKSGYLIQVSSFRNAGDADRLKAQLALLGLHAQVSKADIKGTAWHRVRVGPYKSTEAVRNARQRLASNGHNTLVIKIRP